ncbi:FG-GAP-like repeat-containing protein [Streptomyces sp. NPDC058678]|uniref:FG-GAP-like repeat-containing protein n=1 Tax=Streptomyces sp. NPDC058678 TaxID=3346595 RepID=UPI00364D7BFA
MVIVGVGAVVPGVQAPRQTRADAASRQAAPGGLDIQPTATGSFTHSLPIEIPRFHGLEPPVALDYDSASSNGDVGMGWRLTAGSIINRTGAHGGLARHDGSDVFRLDGMELIACAPSCTTGGTHETYQHTYERIVFADGRWTRHQRNGTRLVYEAIGENPDRSAQWSLHRVVDSHGNTVTYQYDCSGVCRVERITYAALAVDCSAPGQPACRSGAEILFVRELRPDIVVRTTSRGSRQIRTRLKTVAVRMDGQLVTAYALRYKTSTLTGNSVLSSLQRFAGDATVAADGTVTAGPTPPLPATTFTTSSMTGPAGGWAAPPVVSAPLQVTAAPGNREFPSVETTVRGNTGQCVDPHGRGCRNVTTDPVYGDFNGDRLIDVAAWEGGALGCGSLIARLGTSGSWGANAVTSLAAHASERKCPRSGYVTDVNGDSADDIVMMSLTGHVVTAVSRRDGRFTIDDRALVPPWSPFRPVTCATGDLNGDGLGDMACQHHGRLGILYATPEGTWRATDLPVPPDVRDAQADRLAIGDVDASGTGDVMLVGRVAPGLPAAGTVTLITGVTAPDGAVTTWQSTPTTWRRSALAPWQFSPGDLDADGRADFILHSSPDSTTKVLTALSRKGTTLALDPRPEITVASRYVTTGDADADGRDDLITGSPPGYLRSLGDGTFAEREDLGTRDPQSRACAGDWERLSAADVNGDGQADLICHTHEQVNAQPRYSVWAQASHVAPPAPHRWQPFDHNGDGRQDLYAIYNRNPGVEIYTLTAQPGGGYLPDHKPVDLPVDVADTSRWLAADVAGPAGGADGRTDLVLVARDTPCANCEPTLALTTLVSTGQGWDAHHTYPWRKNGTIAPYDAPELHTWRTAELDGDGAADLVYFRAVPGGVRMETLRSQGDGTWTSAADDRFTSNTVPGGPLTRPDVQGFRTMDLNNDHIDDFVHVETGGGPTNGYRVVRSLLSTAPGGWQEETERTFAATDSTLALGLQPSDVNGDGIQDLARPVVHDGCVRLEHQLRHPSGWSTPVLASAPSPCTASKGLEDRKNLRLADVNQDGRTDVYHLSRVAAGAAAQGTVSTLINTGDPAHPEKWRWIDQPGVPAPEPDSWAWTMLDGDHDGVAELAHFGGADPTALRTLRWQAGDDRLTAIDNGLGAVTSIRYAARAEARSYLPAGLLPVTVDEITVTDSAHEPPVRARAQFSYAGALWSNRYSMLVGYGSIRADQGDGIVTTGRDLSEACGARVAATALEVPGRGIIYKTSVAFSDPGTGAPYTCLPDTIRHRTCELTSNCQEKRTVLGYDAYGNTVSVEETAGSLRRRIETPVHPNTTDYIVNRPYKHDVLMATSPPRSTPTTWEPVARTLFGYDDGTWEQPPARHGDLTRITAFSDLGTDTASETFLQYDSFGNLTRTQNPTGIATTSKYDPGRGLFPESQCTPVGCTTLHWDEARGLLRTVTNLNGRTVTSTYDPHGRLLTTTGPDRTTTVSYLDFGTFTGPDTARQRIRTETSDGSGSDQVLWNETLFDGLGRTYRTRAEGTTASPQDVIVTDTEYADASSRPSAASLPRTASQSPRWTHYAYDAAHRLTTLTHPGPGDTLGRAYQPGQIEDRDETGNVTTTRYDGLGRVKGVDQHVRLCPTCSRSTLSTTYDYDLLDQLTTVTNALGQQTTITRDALSRPTAITDPDRGLRTLKWRADGLLDTETDARGTHTWGYDAAGRPTILKEVSPKDDAHISKWIYDRDPRTGQTQGDSVGRLILAAYSTGPLGAVTGSDRTWYDAAGRPTRSRTCVDDVCQAMGYAYDAAGRLSDLHYPDPRDPDGEHVRYRYDNSGRLVSVGSYLTDIRRDAAGHATQQAYGNGLQEGFTYDPDRQWLTSHTLTSPQKPTAPLYTADYPDRDATGRITRTVTNNPTTTNPQPETQTYSYDELGRLITHTSSTTSGAPSTSYAYDKIGRITDAPAAGTYSYGDPAHLHAVTSTSAGHQRTYDEAGQLTTLKDPSGRQLTMDWLPNGMPGRFHDGVTDSSYAYDTSGQLVKHTAQQNTTRFFGRFLEQSPAGLTRYYWAGNQLIATRDPSGDVSYLLQDHQHSTRVVTDSQQRVTARHNYAPFGAERADSLQSPERHRWQGHRSDPASGLIYMNARFYDPELGQFTAPDTIIPGITRPQALNRYGYGSADPVNTWDPTGHVEQAAGEQEHRKMQDFEPADQCLCAKAAAPDAQAMLDGGHPLSPPQEVTFRDDEGLEIVVDGGEEGNMEGREVELTDEEGLTVTVPGEPGEDGDPGEDGTAAAPEPDLDTADRTETEKGFFEDTSSGDVFVWGGGHVRKPAAVESEVLFVGGANDEGWYGGYIYAVGLQLDLGVHITILGGRERTWTQPWGGGDVKQEAKPIGMVDISFDKYSVGAYITEFSPKGIGVFVGASAKFAAAGVGFNLQAVTTALRYYGMMPTPKAP